MEILLLVFGIALIVLNAISINKEKSSFKGSLDDAKDNMKEFNLEIGKLRKEIGETVLDIQNDMEKINNSIKDIKSCLKNNEVGEDNIRGYVENDTKMVHNGIREFNENFNITLNDNLKSPNNKKSNKEVENTKVNKSGKYAKGTENKKKNNLSTKKGSEKTEQTDKLEYNNIKIAEVKKFIDLGMSVEEVSEILDIGKGEVLLIKELYLK